MKKRAKKSSSNGSLGTVIRDIQLSSDVIIIKERVHLLQEEVHIHKGDMRLEMVALRKDMADQRNEMKAMETRLVDQFKVIAENLVYDFKGAFKDRLEQHGDRILLLEKHTGIVAA